MWILETISLICLMFSTVLKSYQRQKAAGTSFWEIYFPDKVLLWVALLLYKQPCNPAIQLMSKPRDSTPHIFMV